MNARRHRGPAVAGLFSLLLVALGAAWVLHSRAGSPTAAASPQSATSNPVSVVDGTTVVEVSRAAQLRAGLLVQPLAAASASQDAVTYGTVEDLRPLVDWRSKLVAAAAQAEAAHSHAGAAKAELARTQALYRDDHNASLRTLQAAQAAAEQAQADARAADSTLRALRQEGQLQLGAEVADELERRAHPAVLDRAHALVRVALPPGARAPREVLVGDDGATPARAHWVSAAAQAEPQLGAAVQLYLVDRALPAHASVTVRVPGTIVAPPGVLVPTDAVVWYADQPWTYLQRDDTHFGRVALLDASEQPQGFFVPAGLQPGEKVVTRGAGLLLSQEQIPPPGSGAGCKDPECDD